MPRPLVAALACASPSPSRPLPVPITTPAHGTAYDIAGPGRADVNATYDALRIAARMGRAR